MSSQTIRLRLVVSRHSVPEVKLVWPCVASEDLTVSKLLALVNEVVPLESVDWGLEDYVVELPDGKGDSFELLHFQPVGKVLKEDDQVLIRSLSTDDLRRRRLSGRHQISDDGKHLIDGLAFGRPWLRQPRDRPALDLPPRKRARITHEEELDDDDASYADDEVQSEQLLLEDSAPPEMDEPSSVRLRARFVDTDQLDESDDEEFDNDGNDFKLIRDVRTEPAIADDDEEDEVESSDDGELDVDLTDELRLLQEDNALIERTPPVEQQSLLSGDNSQDPQALLPTHAFSLSLLDKMTSLRAAFPLTSVTTIQTELIRHDQDLRTTFQALAKANEPTISFDEVMERALLGSYEPEEVEPSDPKNADREEVDNQVLRFPGQPEAVNSTRPLIQEVDVAEEVLPNASRTGDVSALSALINVLGREDAETSSSSSSSESESDSESDGDSDESSDAESSSDSDSDDDSEDDSDDPGVTSSRLNAMDISDSKDEDSSDSDSGSDSSSDSDKAAGAVKDSAESDSDSSDSSSESDSESEPEELSSKVESKAKSLQASAIPEPKAESAIASASQPAEGPKAPGAGLTRTKKRNARRRDLKRLKAMQTLEDTQSQSSTNQAASEDAELMARKRALLSVVSDEHEDAPSPPKDAPVKEARPMIMEVEEEETPTIETTQDVASVPAADPTPAQRRHKFDLGAGRRLLFGALGLKNPKSKADEDKLRNNLMKDVKPLQNPRVQADDNKTNGAEATTEQEDEDPDAWRKKISYRAVECCQDDIVLSEPPFPFVQRWDPQQQYGSMRKRKRASQNFHDESYYDEDSQWNGEEGWDDNSQKKKKKKSKKRKAKGGYDGGYDEEETPSDSVVETRDNGDADVVLNYDDIPAKPRLEDSQFTDVDDLPSLPSDMSTLPSLELAETKPGMVITWKQLLLSKATNWQPEMVPMTGLVLSISEDSYLHILLAKRDRDQDDKEYDEHTGQRVYAKFEAPDFDEDNDEEDDGRREISWGEISEPRLVQQAPTSNTLETSAKITELPTENAKPVQDGNSTADNKVSDTTDPDETMAEELDTQKVRAEVEADLKEREAASKPSETDKSTSIPSGQQPPRLEFMASGDDSPISSFVRPAETPSDMNNSPSRQLQETLQAAIIREQAPSSHNSEDVTKNNMEVEKPEDDEMDGVTDAKDLDEEPVPTVEAGWDTVVPGSMPSPELPSLPTKDDIPIDHRLLVVPSSAGSVRSGRQPPSVNGLEDLPEERVEDSVEPDMITGPHARTPSPQITNVPPRSSSPFPSLEEMFHTARQTQSPGKSTQQSVPRYLKPGKEDTEYEEAMRKLDEGGEESERSPDRNKSLRSLFPNATQPEPEEDLPLLRSFNSEVSKTGVPEVKHAATPPTSQKVKQETQFMIPQGSQVIELSSSPPSVQFTEDYAQDSQDETYQDSPLPQGSGWVQKKMSDVKTRSRGKSLPAAAATTTTTNKTTTTRTRITRGRTSLPPARDVTASAFSQIRGRRKSTRKF
ncbi:hypothetical protein FSARC_14172 [Fusarium sarcochroum]|uniref:DUF7357 domain-containing protein n=1 Tax=Fusarium sarcochroum TaxID=1208366 RepID=A0A8H4SVJ4_9HYPO|nr:hypothetical protein FSARC_14172 [Fusarium sarcochroum]